MKVLKTFPLSLTKKTAGQFNKSFHAKLFTLFASSMSELMQLAKDFPVHYKYCLCFIKDDFGQWFLGADSIERVRKYIVKQANNNFGQINKYYLRWQKNWQKFLKLNKQLIDFDLNSLPDKRLYKVFTDFYGLYLKVGGVAYISDAFMSSGETDWLQEVINQELGRIYKNIEKVKKVASDLISPVHLSFVLEEEFELLKLAPSLIDSNGRLINFKKLSVRQLAQLEYHAEKYYWMNNNYYNVEFYNAASVYEHLVHLLDGLHQEKRDLKLFLSERQRELQENKRKRSELINDIRLPKKIKSLIQVANLFSKWKDVRKSGVYRGMAIFDKFLVEFARRSGYTKKEVTFLVFPEIKDLLLNKKDFQSVIKDRQRQVFFVVRPNDYLLVSGQEADKYFACLSDGLDVETKKFKGAVASKGIAQGVVRMIRKTEEMAKFKEGEILVTNNTTPEFVPIMKKAAAIITEQGGITSHAAVVSRELHKPCIIGVKGITTVLKTGVRVEVDANHGIIKIIRN